MKKLSIEEKAKRYDEAIERAESIYNETAIPSATTKGICTYIFPELKESDDDRMVKFIKNQLFNIKKTITENYELDAKLTKAICWLEKQCEQKIKTPEESLGIDSDTYNKIVDECIYGEQKPALSEEDEEIYRKCICAMRASACGFPEEEKFVEQVDNWFKSIKERYTWKPSEEQMNTLEYYMHTLICNEHKEVLFGLYADLKKLTEK